MVERQPVGIAEILPAVFTVKRQVHPLTTEGAGGVQGMLLLFKKAGEKSPYPAGNSHASYVLTSQVKNELQRSMIGLLAFEGTNTTDVRLKSALFLELHAVFIILLSRNAEIQPGRAIMTRTKGDNNAGQ